jgi:hypothetical protein
MLLADAVINTGDLAFHDPEASLSSYLYERRPRNIRQYYRLRDSAFRVAGENRLISDRRRFLAIWAYKIERRVLAVTSGT